jgi:class 3 adenylate cyclase
MAVSRRLVAVFAADVEGYSRLMGADEIGTLKGLTERRAILDRFIGEHRGRIANTAGDSVGTQGLADDLRGPWRSAGEEHSRAHQGLSGGRAE